MADPILTDDQVDTLIQQFQSYVQALAQKSGQVKDAQKQLDDLNKQIATQTQAASDAQAQAAKSQAALDQARKDYSNTLNDLASKKASLDADIASRNAILGGATTIEQINTLIQQATDTTLKAQKDAMDALSDRDAAVAAKRQAEQDFEDWKKAHGM